MKYHFRENRYSCPQEKYAAPVNIFHNLERVFRYILNTFETFDWNGKAMIVVL